MHESSMRGFIALISAVLISAILLVVALAASLNGFTARFSVLDAELKQKSSVLVDACADYVLAKLASDSSYVGPETVTLGSDTCQVVGVVAAGINPVQFQLQAVYKKSYTNALVSIDTSALSITDWQEVGHL